MSRAPRRKIRRCCIAATPFWAIATAALLALAFALGAGERARGEPATVGFDAADTRPPVGEVVRLGEKGPHLLAGGEELARGLARRNLLEHDLELFPQGLDTRVGSRGAAVRSTVMASAVLVTGTRRLVPGGRAASSRRRMSA